MKAFRDWWEKHRASVSPHTWQSSRGENLAQLADEEIWRAALLWFWKTAEHISPSDYEILEEELGDETKKD